MKIYEIRDVSDEDTYYQKGFYSHLEIALTVCKIDGWMLSDDCGDIVTLEIHEHELDKKDSDKMVFKINWEKDYREDDEEWKSEIEYEMKAEVPRG